MNLLWVAEDLHKANPNIPTKKFFELLHSSRLWNFDWGVIFAIKNEMHIHILSPFRKRVFLRPPIQKIATEMFKEYEELTTKVSKNKPESLHFDMKMGWKLEKETEYEWHLKINKEGFKYGKS